jgi:hypothetical protein
MAPITMVCAALTLSCESADQSVLGPEDVAIAFKHGGPPPHGGGSGGDGESKVAVVDISGDMQAMDQEVVLQTDSKGKLKLFALGRHNVMASWDFTSVISGDCSGLSRLDVYLKKSLTNQVSRRLESSIDLKKEVSEGHYLRFEWTEPDEDNNRVWVTFLGGRATHDTPRGSDVTTIDFHGGGHIRVTLFEGSTGNAFVRLCSNPENGNTQTATIVLDRTPDS